MQRDLDLIRNILLKLESSDPGRIMNAEDLGFEESPTISEHVQLLIDADLIDGQVEFYMGDGSDIQIHRLTWSGHEFLSAMRDDTIWKKITSKVVKPSASWTWGILLEVAKEEARATLGFPIK